MIPIPSPTLYYVTAAGVATGLALLVPFFTYRPWELYDRLRFSADVYKYGSVNAYNFWGWQDGLFNPGGDGIEYLGLTYQVWGVILFAIATVIILFVMRKSEGTGALALGTAISMLAFYLLVTRMHERYLFPAFLPFLAGCVLFHSRHAWAAYLLWGTFLLLAVLHFLNLYYVYSYYPLNFPVAGVAPEPPAFQGLYDWIKDPNEAKALSLLATVTLLPLLVVGFMWGRSSTEAPEVT